MKQREHPHREMLLRRVAVDVREKRAEKGWTIAQLAQYAGVGLTAVKRAEAGQEITLSNCLLMLDALEGPEYPAAVVSEVYMPDGMIITTGCAE